MRSFKIVAMLLISAFLLSSCGIIIINRGDKEGGGQAETTSPQITYEIPEYPVTPEIDYEEKARQAVEALSNIDFNGLSAIIAAATETGNVFNDTEGVYKSTVIRRNNLIADKYNTKIVTDYKAAATLYSQIRTAYKSGEYYADFAAVRSLDMGTYFSSGYLQNLRALSYTDFEEEYFNSQAMDQLTVGNVIYGAVGAMTETPEMYSCLFYNKTLASELGLSLDYSSVYNFSFTWDKLFTQLSSVGEGAASLVSSYGKDYISRYFFASEGQTFLTKQENGNFASSFVNDTSVSLVANIKKLISYRSESLTFNKTVTDDAGNETTQKVTLSNFDIFSGGKALVACGLLSDMSKLTNCGFDWEVLPMPKLTEEGTYHTSVSTDAPVLVLLKSSPNIDTNGYILQALGAASNGYIEYTFIKGAMRDHITGIYSADMLELIIENPIYDHATMFGSKYASLKNGTYTAFYNAVNGKSSLSYYANKYKSSLESYLRTLK